MRYGQAAGLTYGNGQIYAKTINNLMRPTRVWSQKDGTKAFDRSYQYDNRGLVTNITDSVNGAYSQAFSYDGLGQLKTASGIWGAGGFTYDSLGNIRSKTLGTRNVLMSYASNNRLTSYTDSGSGPNKSLSYDSRGNVTALGSLNFVYDYADQPRSVSGTASGTYTYDGNFKRVKNTVGGSPIYTVYDASGSLVHIDDSGTGNATDYVSGAGMSLARIENNAVTYLHNDHLGSAASGTNSSGSVLWTQHYTPFGDEWNAVAANDDQAGFTGHIRDEATGLNYMQARYYDPIVGRFLSIDPVTFLYTGSPAYFNRYAYVGNDPINHIDPTGMCAVLRVEYSDGTCKSTGGYGTGTTDVDRRTGETRTQTDEQDEESETDAEKDTMTDDELWSLRVQVGIQKREIVAACEAKEGQKCIDDAQKATEQLDEAATGDMTEMQTPGGDRASASGGYLGKQTAKVLIQMKLNSCLASVTNTCANLPVSTKEAERLRDENIRRDQ